MSKIGKKNITIPKESTISIDGPNLTIKGPKGSKTLTINDKIFSSVLKENEFKILPLEKKIDKKTSIMWGTYRSLINNAVTGVSNGHEKILELNGRITNSELSERVGLSKTPCQIRVKNMVEKGIIKGSSGTSGKGKK